MKFLDTLKELKEMIIQVFNKLKEAFNEAFNEEFEGVNEVFAHFRVISEEIKILAKKKYKPVKCIGSTKSAVLPCKRQYKARSCC